MANAKLEMLLMARDGASSAFNSAARAADKLAKAQDRVHKSSKSMPAVGKALAGVGAAVSLAAAGRAVQRFAADSIKTYQNVAKETLAMQRVMGGTPESVSAMRGAVKLAGVDIAGFTKSMGFLSKQMVKDGSPALAKLGVSARTAGGALRPTSAVLKDLAARFQTMPNGAEKTAAALAIFGRSGAAMLPFLSRGAKGIAELEEKTKRYGLVLTGKQLDAVKKQSMAQRELSMAMEGTKLQFGAALAPVLTKLQMSLANTLPQLSRNLTPAFLALGAAATTMVGEIDQRMPAIERGAASLGVKIGEVAKSFQANWPEIRSTIENVAAGLDKAGQFASVLFGAFRSLPPEVQSTLAMLAVLQKTGAINVAFKGFDIAKSIFGKVMGINAGVVNVNGPVAGGKGAVPGAAGKAAGGAGLASILGSVATVGAITVAAGAALHWVLKPYDKMKQQGANANTMGGMYGSIGGGYSTVGGREANRIADARTNWRNANPGGAGAGEHGGRATDYKVKVKAEGAAAMKAALDGVNAAVGALPKEKSTKVTTPGAALASVMFGNATKQANRIPGAKSTKVSAPGAAIATSMMKNTTGAANAIPRAKGTQVSAPGAGVTIGALMGVTSAALSVPGSTQTYANATDNASYVIQSVRNALNNIDGAVAHVTIVGSSIGGAIGAMMRDGGQVAGFADGGIRAAVARDQFPRRPSAIVGAGTSTSDSIPTMLSNGEFVMRTAAVKKYGLGVMYAMNAMKLASGGEAQWKEDWVDYNMSAERKMFVQKWAKSHRKMPKEGPIAYNNRAVGAWHNWVGSSKFRMAPAQEARYKADLKQWQDKTDQQAGQARSAAMGFVGGLAEYSGLSGMVGAIKDQKEAELAVSSAGSPAERKQAQARAKELEGSTNPQGWLRGKLAKIRELGAMLTTLKGRGVASALLAEVAKAGPEDGVALGNAILSSNIADLNNLQNQLDVANAQVGWTQFNNANEAQGRANNIMDAIFERTAQGQPVVQVSADFYLDGKALYESLVRLRRQRGAGLGLG